MSNKTAAILSVILSVATILGILSLLYSIMVVLFQASTLLGIGGTGGIVLLISLFFTKYLNETENIFSKAEQFFNEKKYDL